MNNKNHDKSSIFGKWDLDNKNYKLFAIGILIIIFGYYLMISGETISFQSTKLSPIILVIGYCIIIPFSIFYKFKK